MPVAEAAADHEVRAGVEAGFERRELAGIVLAVGVELERALVAGALGVAEPGLQRAADPEVERQVDHVHAGGARERGGLVDRAVGDDDDVEIGPDLAQLRERRRQRGFLVVRGNHDERSSSTARRTGSGYPLAPDAHRVIPIGSGSLPRRLHPAARCVHRGRMRVRCRLFAFTLPPLAGADEGVHFLRAWHVSNGHVFAESGHRAGDPAPDLGAYVPRGPRARPRASS